MMSPAASAWYLLPNCWALIFDSSSGQAKGGFARELNLVGCAGSMMSWTQIIDEKQLADRGNVDRDCDFDLHWLSIVENETERWLIDRPGVVLDK